MIQDNREPTRARRSARYAYENGSANNDEPESIAIETETNLMPQSRNIPEGGEAEMREPMDGQHNLQPNDGYRAQPSAGETNPAVTNPAAQPQPISPAAYCAVRCKPFVASGSADDRFPAGKEDGHTPEWLSGQIGSEPRNGARHG